MILFTGKKTCSWKPSPLTLVIILIYLAFNIYMHILFYLCVYMGVWTLLFPNQNVSGESLLYKILDFYI